MEVDHTTIRKVGTKYNGSKAPAFIYKDVHYLDGWADCTRFLPAPFDLVLMKLDNEKVRPGWHTGTGWDGLKLRDDEKILYWKRKETEEDKI